MTVTFVTTKWDLLLKNSEISIFYFIKIWFNMFGTYCINTRAIRSSVPRLLGDKVGYKSATLSFLLCGSAFERLLLCHYLT